MRAIAAAAAQTAVRVCEGMGRSGWCRTYAHPLQDCVGKQDTDAGNSPQLQRRGLLPNRANVRVRRNACVGIGGRRRRRTRRVGIEVGHSSREPSKRSKIKNRR